MADREVLEARLAKAEDTLDKLLTGELEREMSQNGKSVAFNLPSESKLRAHINELKSQLGLPIIGPHRSRCIFF